MTAPSTGDAGDLRLDIPQGQRALVVIDPQERFAYIDGHVTLRYNGELMFLAQLLDPTEVVDLFAGELPLRHQATVHVTGALTDRLDASHLELAGRYAVDGGRVGEWLKLEGEPLALEGNITLTPAGLLATGVVRSSIAPQQVLDSAVQAQLFIPFRGDVQDAYVEVRSRLDVPVAAVHADAMARLDGGLETVAEANMSAPWNAQDATALVEAGVAGGNDAEEVAQANAEDEPGRWARTVDTVAGSTRAGYGRLAELASAGWDVTASGAQQSAKWSAEMAARGWCGVSGRCDALPLAEPMETAMR